MPAYSPLFRLNFFKGGEMPMEKKKSLPFDAILAIVMMGIMAALAIDGIFIHKLSVEAMKYPLFCFAIVGVACLIEIGRSLQNQKVAGEQAKAKPLYYNKKNFFITVGMLGVYVIVMWLFGFIVASVAMSMAFTWFYKIRKWVLVNVVTALVVVAIYFIFSNSLYIFLPKGLLFNLIF